MPTSFFKVFQERNYSLFFAGQSLSQIGTWVQGTTVNWLLFELTDSPLWLGYLSAAITLPMLFLLPFAGAWVDRLNRRRLLLLLQALFMIPALTLGITSHFGILTLPIIVAMGCLQSVLTAFDGPARQSFVPMLVTDRDNLPAAISLSSMMFNTTRALGPPLAGWMLAQVGPAPCFLLNATSYFLMLGALLLIHAGTLPKITKPKKRRGALHNLSFIFHNPLLRYLVVSFTAVAIATMSVYVLLPIWADDVLGAGPQGLGLLRGSVGVGALIGAVIIGTQRQPTRLWYLFRYAALLLGISLILLSKTHGAAAALLMTALLGLAYTAQGVATNTLIQLNISDEQRGGVMAIYLLASFGSIPVGNLLGGMLGEWLGPHGAAMVGGLSVLTITLLLWRTGSKIIKNLPKHPTSTATE